MVSRPCIHHQPSLLAGVWIHACVYAVTGGALATR